MDFQTQQIKMTAVDADLFESVGYEDATRTMVVKFRDGTTIRFEKVPRFRLQGILSAPRKDAYFRSFIKNQFLSKQV
jgi:hypothetical protein